MIGLRKTIELVCKDQIRDFGNEAAHETQYDGQFSVDLINELIEFTEIILTYLYVLPEKISLLEKQIENNKSKRKDK